MTSFTLVAERPYHAESDAPAVCSPPVFGADPDVSNVPGQPRLLLVERDMAMQLMLMKILSADYQVEVSGDALEACQTAKLRPPDLIVIDLYAPGTDNLTLIRAMRANPATTHVPIIMLTVSLHREALLRCLTAGASNFLLKPFNTAELLMCARVELQLRGTHSGSGR